MYFLLMSIIYAFLCVIQSADKIQGIEEKYIDHLDEISKLDHPSYLKDACDKLANIRLYHAKMVNLFHAEHYYQHISRNFVELIDTLIMCLRDKSVCFDLPFAKTPKVYRLSDDFLHISLFSISNLWWPHFTFIKFIRFYLCSNHVLDFIKRALKASEKNSIQLLLERLDIDLLSIQEDYARFTYVYNQVLSIILALAVDKDLRCNFIWTDEVNDLLYKELKDLIFFQYRVNTEDEEPCNCFFSYDELSCDKNGNFTLSKDIAVSNLKLIVISDQISNESETLNKFDSQTLIYNSRYYMMRAIMYTLKEMNIPENTFLARYDGKAWEIINEPRKLEHSGENYKLFFAVMFELIE